VKGTRAVFVRTSALGCKLDRGIQVSTRCNEGRQHTLATRVCRQGYIGA
jgi:cold shock CspA family protein